MNTSFPLNCEITSLSFGCLSVEEIRKISVKEVNVTALYDAIGSPVEGGPYDPAFGPLSALDICVTCGDTQSKCLGHFGHIELPCLVYHPLFFEHMVKVLRSLCTFCHRFKVGRFQMHKFAAKLVLLHYGLLIAVRDIDGAIVPDISDEGDGDDSSKDANVEVIDEYVAKVLYKHRKLIMKGEVIDDSATKEERKRLTTEFLKNAASTRRCANCEAHSATIRSAGTAKVFQVSLTKKQLDENAANSVDQTLDEDEDDINVLPIRQTRGNVFLTPYQVHRHIRLLFENEPLICGLLYGDNTSTKGLFQKFQSAHESRDLASLAPDKHASSDMFFVQVILVPPNRFRPTSSLGEQVYENPQNAIFTKILNTCERIRALMTTSAKKTSGDLSTISIEDLPQQQIALFNNEWLELQYDVNGLVDSTKTRRAFEGLHGVRQILEKKEGLMRKHLMGKRVNYAARSVISPDPNVETDEIGVPEIIAKRLTYPETVTPFNVRKLATAVINGPHKWPGATHIEFEDGTLQGLASLSTESRIAVANTLSTPSMLPAPFDRYQTVTNTVNKKVYRHICNGDMLLVNRQPTLHKPSIMAHRARVLPAEKTIRLHYANCQSYNADFDGDEMNIHLPQNEIARAEAMFVGSAGEQYLSSTSGAPLRGLIQDHVVTGVWLSSKETFFTREQYCQILYGALRPDSDGIVAQPVLTIPPAIQKPRSLWTGKQVVTTILYNVTYGHKQLNFTSRTRISDQYWRKASAEEATVIVSDGELLTGVLDKSQIGASSFGLIHSCHELYGRNVAEKLLGIFGRLFTAYTQWQGFSCRMDDLRLTPKGNKLRCQKLRKGPKIGEKAVWKYVGMEDEFQNAEDPSVKSEFIGRMREVLQDDDKHKDLDSTMKSEVNVLTSSIISSCIPKNLLVPFPSNNMQMMTAAGAKGSSVNVSQISCLLGQQELEGRRVPVMASGKTLPSFKAYDTSPMAGGYVGGRFLTGVNPQEYFFHCMAGREGLIDTAVKTSRSGYLQRCLIKHLEGLIANYDGTVRNNSDGSLIQFHYGEDAIDVTKQKHLYKFDFVAENWKSYNTKYGGEVLEKEATQASRVRKLNKKALENPNKYGPVISNPEMFPYNTLGSVSEHFESSLQKFIKNNKKLVGKRDEDKPGRKLFSYMMHKKYQQSLVEPGEAVGLLAAQGIGEPSTQMTLNTFHFAGFGAKNVTLGIPRLREILMVASDSIKTPMMRLPLKTGVSKKKAEKFPVTLSRLTLAEVVDEIVVTEKIVQGRLRGSWRKAYFVRMNFFPSEEYVDEYDISPKQVEVAIGSQFITMLRTSVTKFLAKKNKKDADIGKALKFTEPITNETTDEVDPTQSQPMNDSDDCDGDATASRMNSRRKQMVSYDEPDEDDMEIIVESDENNEKEDDGNVAEKDTEDASSKKKSKEQGGLAISHQFDVKGEWCEIDIQIPSSTAKVLMLEVVEKVCRDVVLREVPGISKCYPVQKMNDGEYFITDGVNILGIVQNGESIIEINNIYTNDIAAVLRVYGVEAARAVIIKEVSSVFQMYGIAVDARHLTLVADYMTHEGGFNSYSRGGMESNTSPLLQMSFERTCYFLTQAVIHGYRDTLRTPSARLVVGKVTENGTGCFNVMQTLS
ncbi:1597_t:CDS:10 [Paraglomus brasilianum]|uniref:DNA-directed RNA polymerase subunit n=1 Tax=Paraglomus brasilianum TaxID=144538 RepID=A0A9N8W5Y8_9GLOM|nr:1597_t:CDS:10 [Paraglomus brasilianum]